MAPEISLGGNFVLDKHGQFFATTKIYGYIKYDSIEEDYYFWLGLMNSNLFWFFIKNTGYILRGGYYTFKTNYIKPFPIPNKIDKNISKKVSELAKVIENNITKRISNSETDLELQVDNLVYKLYKITYDEVLIIEPEFNVRMSKEEYEALEN